MRLIELNPRWFVLETDGQRVGLTFDCPHCRVQRLGIAFHHRGYEAIDDGYIRARNMMGTIWLINSAEDFEVLSIVPSVDASESGHWHGFITKGEIK